MGGHNVSLSRCINKDIFRCPICRYTQTPEIVPDQKCFDCGLTSDLWMCLICGNIGCGRYAAAHAYK